MPALDSCTLYSLVPRAGEWPVFVETGTYLGETIFSMEPLFEELHTVELSRDHWGNAKKAYQGDKICFHLGDSAKVMETLLPTLQRPAVFFLDGHWSCEGTERGPIDVPLLEELDAIRRLFLPKALVIVDDLRLFGMGPHSGEPVNWTNIGIDAIRSAVGNRLVSLQEHKELDKLVIKLCPIENVP